MITSYDRLPIGKYLDILKVSSDKEMSEIDSRVAIISILTDKTEDELMHLPIPEFKALSHKASFLNEEVPTPKRRKVSTITVGDMVFDVTTDIRKLTTAQYVDFQAFTAQEGNHIVEILSCFLVPKGMEYNEGYDIVDVQRVIRDNLTVTDAVTMYAFFLSRLKRLIMATLIYSHIMTRRLPRKMEKEKKILLDQIEEAQILLAGIGDGWMR